MIENCIRCGRPTPYDINTPIHPVTLIMPANTVRIESEAFAELPGTYRMVMTDTVMDIAPDAFPGTDIIIVAPAGSYAQTWAQEKGVAFEGQ